MPYALLVVAGAESGMTYPLPENRSVTLGRDSGNDIALLDRKLSRIHSQVEIIAGRVQVSDLNSTNGTLVNGHRITGEAWLRPEDEIELGTTRLRLIEVAPAEAALAEDRRGDVAATIPAEDASVCAECGAKIPDEEAAAGQVRAVGQRRYCARCSATFEKFEVDSTISDTATISADRFKPGTEIAGIRILSVAGEGNLGPLYKGEQMSMGRVVAIKVLSVTEPEWARQYLQAVYNAGQLVHANIALIFDTGEQDGLYYVVREYVEGQSMQDRMAVRQPMPLPQAHAIITQVASAIEHATERQIFHGSLSPRRILLGERDMVKVVGFGLPLNPPPGRSLANYIWHALPYLPPERVKENAAPKAVADVYSVVAVLYHLLTGRPPFSGSTHEKIEKRILTQTPKPLSEYAKDLPPSAQKIIDRGLAKDPRARYQLPRELLFDLEETLRREM